MSTRPWEDEALLTRLADAMSNANELLASVATSPGGIIVLNRVKPDAAAAAAPAAEAAAGAAGAAGGSGAAQGTFDEFAPFQMAQHAERSLLHFGSFSEAVDEFFSKLEVQPRAGLDLP